MWLIILIIILFIFFKIWKAQTENSPENLISQCEMNAYNIEKEFEKAKDMAIKDMEDENDVFISMFGKKEYKKIINELRQDNKLKNQLKDLNIHLQEKYKTEPVKRINIWNDYIDWLSAVTTIYENRIAIHYVDNTDEILESNNENYLKAMTIKKRLVNLADLDVVNLIKININK